MVYYADISEVWNMPQKLPVVKDRFRNDRYLWEQKHDPLKVQSEPLEIQSDPLEVPSEPLELEPEIVQEVSQTVQQPIDSSDYLNVILKNTNICNKLKEYSDEYKSKYIESLIEDDMEPSGFEDYEIYIKIIFVVLLLELFKLLLIPLIRRG